VRRSPNEVFWERVPVGEPDQCWLWSGVTFTTGYGCFRIGRQMVSAHRFSWALHNGPIPEGMLIRHKCDVPACVNPGHLLVGTRLDNARDAIERNRYPRGLTHGRSTHPENFPKGNLHHMSKLQEVDIPFIRLWLRRGKPVTHIGEAFGVDGSAISKIRDRHTWKHVQ
jgi:HNH endonuclease